MAWHSVEQGWTCQAENGSDEKEKKNEFVDKVNVVVTVVAERLDVEHDCRDQESHEPDQMCPEKLERFQQRTL